ncbi:gliding motility-associated C-terminal domain-containing protein [Sediminibacterium ginsengisoli]|uniref:Gliding motility-associated C-terminal domain-containing protein n=1 Tax=Sediminibacterium ginsengisoli TaxID=413434 RepID=A0A1T4RBE3_9BACT|nr:gliding motility-associated C-terminal domain-containing protein [Sediminibacterium ginsengisoli]SKA13217.1 gliding motility-associated C-terminal domain-containing protein [Sediminibacterium ginsengisoli]
MKKLHSSKSAFIALTLLFCLFSRFSRAQLQVPCGYATSQQQVASGVCVLCAVQNPGRATDGDTTTFSVINTTVGATGYFGQLLRFGSTYLTGDTVSVMLEVPSTLISAQLLGGIRLETYMGTTPNGDAITGSLARVQLLGGNTNKFRLSFAATMPFDGVSVSLNGAVSLLSSLRVYAAQAYVTPPVIVNRSGIQANAQGGTVFSGVCVLCSVDNPGRAVDRDTSTYSAVRSTVGALGYVGELLKFPSGFAAGDSIRLMLQVPSQVIDAQVLGGIRVETYTGNTANGNPVTLGGGLARVELLNQEGKYSVTFAANHAFDGVSVSINGLVAALSTLRIYDAAVISFSQNIQTVCAGSSATINAALPAGADISWFTTASGGSAVATGAFFTTPPVNSSVTYYAQAARNGCVNPNRVAVVINPVAIPAAPAISPSTLSICVGDSVKAVATAPAGVDFKWYTVPAGGTSFFSGDSLAIAGPANSTVYYAEAVNQGCASATRTPLGVTVNALPANLAVTPPSATIAAGETASFTASSSDASATYNWYLVNTAGSAIYTGASFTTPVLNASTTYYVEARSTAGCVSAARLAVPVTVSGSIANNTPCDRATSQTTDISGLCVACSVSNAARATDTDTTSYSTLSVVAGLAGAYAEQTLVFPFAAAAADTVRIGLHFNTGVADVNLLSSLQVASYNGVTYNNDRTAFNNALVNVQLLNGGQDAVISFVPQAAFDRVQIRVSSGLAGLIYNAGIRYAVRIKPFPAVTPSAPAICAASSVTLNAAAIAGNSYRWYDAATGGTLLFTGGSFTTPVINATTTYYLAVVSSTGCEQAARLPVAITVSAVPADPVVTATQVNICSGSTASMSIQSPDPALTYNWYTAATGGTAVHTGTNFTTGNITTDTAFYVEAVNAGGCSSANRIKVTVTANTIPAAPVTSAAGTTVCAGSSATLSVQNPVSGYTYRWYDVPAAGAVLGTGASYTTASLTSDKTYYVEAVSGAGCPGPRTAVPVTVNPAPAAPTVTVTPPSATISSGETAALAISGPVGGNTYYWYTQSTGGVSAATGTTYTTPALAATTTFYAEAASAAGCRSTTRTPVTITVNAVNNLTCDAATSETSNTNAIVCIGCNVSTPGGATDTDTTTFSQLNMTVAALGAYIQQTLIFPHVSETGDALQLIMEGPVGLATATIAGAIRIETFNGGVSNGDVRAINDALVNITLLGGTKFAVRFTPAAAFDRVQVTLDGGLVGALNNVRIYYATIQVSPPVPTANTVTLCNGGTANLAVTPRSNVTVSWYTTPSGGVAFATGNNISVPNITSSVTYYAEAARTSNNCVNPTRVPVMVVVNPAPAAPAVASANPVICAGTAATLQVTNPDNTLTYRWYDGSNVLAHTGIAYTTPVLSNSTNYSVEAVNSTNCPSSTRTAVAVTVTAAPDLPVIAGNTNVCINTGAVLSVSNAVVGVTYNWYKTSAGGSIVYTGASFTTPPVTENTAYYVEAVSGGGCGSSGRTAVNLTVSPAPAAPQTASNNIQVCTGAQATLSVLNPQPGYVYRWYDAPVNGNLLYTGASVSANPVSGTVTVYVEASTAAGCLSSSRTAVVLQETTIPAAPAASVTGGSVCANSSAILVVQSPAPGITYRWYDAAAAGNLLYTGTSFSTPALDNNTSYFVEAMSSAGCTSTRTTVAVTVNQKPDLPEIAPATLNVTAGGTAVFDVVSPQAGVTYNWYNAASAGTLLYSGTHFSASPVNANASYFVEAVNGAGCTSNGRQVVTVTVGNMPSAPTVTGNGSPVCAGTSATLAIVNPEAGVSYNWYDASTGGNLLFTSTSITTPLLSNTTSYYVAAVKDGQSSARTTVTVNVSPKPSAPVIAPASVNTCSGAPVSLQVQSPDPAATYNWYNVPVGGSSLNSGTVFNTTAVAGSSSYYAETMTAAGCTSNRTAVNITAGTTPAAPQITGTATTNVCTGSPATLNILNPQSGFVYNWYDAPGGGNLLYSGATITTGAVNANVTLYAEAVSTGCSSTSRTAVALVAAPVPAAPAVSVAPQPACSGTQAVLAIQSPDPSFTYRWYDAPAGGNLLFTGNTFTTNPLSGTVANYYAEANGTNGCGSTRTTATVNILPAPATPDVVPASFTVSANGQATFNINNPQAGITYRWYSAASGGMLLYTGTSFNTGNVSATTSYYVEAVSGAGCTSPARKQVVVTVAPPPAAPVVSGNAAPVCAGNTATLVVVNPNPVYTYRWYDAATGGTLVFSGSSFTTNPLSVNITYYVEAVFEGQTSTRTAVTVTVNPRPAAPVLVPATVEACANAPLVLRVDLPVTGNTYNWYNAATGGTSVFSGTVYTVNAPASGVYYVDATNSFNCTSTGRTALPVTILQPLPAPVPVVDSRTATSVTFSWNAIGGAAGYEVTTNGGTSFTTPSTGAAGLKHTVGNLQPGNVVTFQVRALGVTTCQNSMLSVTLNGTSDNPLGDGIYIPNAFSPNGDGRNDRFKAYGNTIASMDIMIYSQWGSLLYNQKNDLQGWDGISDGKRQPTGVYIYIINIVLQNGTKVTRTGSLNLIR